MIELVIGIVIGVALAVAFAYCYLLEPFAPASDQLPPSIEQFRSTQVPEKLREFLKSGEDGQGISRWESCNSISLLLHMLFQEHKDTRLLRRWVHKRLQMEMNDLTTRSTAMGRFIQEIRIRELSLGTKFLTINSIRVENVEMAEDNSTFEKIVFILDIDYSGGFETSIDVSTMILKKGNLSLKIAKLTGMLRVILSRQPYHHWTFSFVSQPIFETEVNSHIQGHQLKRLIPVIKEGIRRSLQRKHVWPNYKIRYRPFFPNPIFQASPPINSFSHIKMEGGIEVTVLQCSRLKSSLLDEKNKTYEIYCTVSIENRPIVQNEEQGHVVNVLLTFSRYDVSTPIGIVFDKTASTNSQSRPVKVCSVEDNSLADKASFKPGDVLVAINSVPIRSERQAARFLQSTTGDMTVLVERSLDDIDDEESKDVLHSFGSSHSCSSPTLMFHTDDEILVSAVRDIDGSTGNDADTSSMISSASVTTGEKEKEEEKTTERSEITSPKFSEASALAARRRHSVSNFESSVIDTNTESVASSIFGLDAHKFDKPPVVSVQRAESARVPQLLISQPSFDLRRTQSESHLDAKVIDAVLSSSADFGMENSIEDEIKLMLVGDLNRSVSGNNLDPHSLGVVRKEDKDKTLTQADAAKGLALITSLQQTGSVASLSSVVSNRTDTGTEEVVEDEETGGIDRKRPASTRKAKIQATLAAGKKKVLDLMPQKRKLTDATDFNGESIEIGADAGSLYDTEMHREPSTSRSPMMSTGKRKDSPSEDKKEKKRLKKKLSESPKIRRSDGQKDQSPMTTVKTRTTKSVQFQKDVLWGQSLHFELDAPSDSTVRSSIRYLNVTVHAKEVKSAGTPNTSAVSLPSVTPSTPESVGSSTTTDSSSNTSATAPEPKPILLGSVSLFVPQLIDDCRMTLSNCHREVFQLKQPSTSTPTPPAGIIDDPLLSEFSRHAGFDPRLCFGDITLGFRFFPDGFPTDKAMNFGDESEDEVAKVTFGQDAASPTRPFSPPALAPASHDWKMWYGKTSTTCAMCRGKIWLRNASCCCRCLVICHNKCVIKANNGGIACSPQQQQPPSHLPLPDDSHFEIISAAEVENAQEQQSRTPLDHTHDETHALLLQSPSTSSMISSSSDTPDLSKRARFKKVTEKFSNWRKGGKKKDDDGTPTRKDTLDSDGFSADLSSVQQEQDSPMASIQYVLSDVLPELDGSPFISGLYFQPGNAYNEQTIKNAKVLGREIFSDYPTEQRVEKINSQIDRIQTAIRETKDDRLVVIQSGGETSAKFQGLDERLQALAVLMLHYCSALQDCQSGRSTPAPPADVPEENNLNEESEECPSVDTTEEDTESVLDEDTVTAEVPVQDVPQPLIPAVVTP